MGVFDPGPPVALPGRRIFFTLCWRCLVLGFGNPHAATFALTEYNRIVKKEQTKAEIPSHRYSFLSTDTIQSHMRGTQCAR
jgi:hypothetical protein